MPLAHCHQTTLENIVRNKHSCKPIYTFPDKQINQRKLIMSKENLPVVAGVAVTTDEENRFNLNAIAVAM
ncbi:hypothetical protein [Candidatus Fukatsuia symbiotica]|uniref:hypothetical protein n=1 Tax=Candidatus Fukatsuia symbiotica TaxID=1878942 RepID=UPI001966F44B|nr:hypothetical protein [Candidatus Fukatsuia symbiotica]